jgi:hypothetical protein
MPRRGPLLCPTDFPLVGSLSWRTARAATAGQTVTLPNA